MSSVRTLSDELYPVGMLFGRGFDRALVDPLRELLYDIVLTCLSVVAALIIGTAEGCRC